MKHPLRRSFCLFQKQQILSGLEALEEFLRIDLWRHLKGENQALQISEVLFIVRKLAPILNEHVQGSLLKKYLNQFEDLKFQLEELEDNFSSYASSFFETPWMYFNFSSYILSYMEEELNIQQKKDFVQKLLLFRTNLNSQFLVDLLQYFNLMDFEKLEDLSNLYSQNPYLSWSIFQLAEEHVLKIKLKEQNPSQWNFNFKRKTLKELEKIKMLQGWAKLELFDLGER